MSFRFAMQSLKFSSLVKSEALWRHLSEKCNAYSKLNKYKQFISHETNISSSDVSNYLHFHPNTFRIYPTNIMENLIKDSFNIFKSKNLCYDVEVYNAVLKSYVRNSLTFDDKSILKDMNDKQIKLNSFTYYLFISHYCQLGKMEDVEYLLKKNTEEISESKLYEKIIQGYIIAGQPDLSKKYIKDKGLDENNINIMKCKAVGYASIGDMENLIQIINKIHDSGNSITVKMYLRIFMQLAKSNAKESDLDQILSNVTDPMSEDIFETILHLNRLKLFECSSKILSKYGDKIQETSSLVDLSISFNTHLCPILIYFDVLTYILTRETLINNTIRNLFINVTYNQGYKFAQTILSDTNSIHLSMSLIDKSKDEKSIDLMTKSLHFAFKTLDKQHFNSMVQFEVIPAMLQTHMAEDCIQILDSLPSFKEFLLPVALLYCLCNCDFDQFQKLKPYNNFMLHLTTQPASVADNIIANYKSLKEVEIFVKEALTVFHSDFVNHIVSILIYRWIEIHANNNDKKGIEDLLELSEKLNVEFTMFIFNKLKNVIPEYENKMQTLIIKEKKEIFNQLGERKKDNCVLKAKPIIDRQVKVSKKFRK